MSYLNNCKLFTPLGYKNRS